MASGCARFRQRPERIECKRPVVLPVALKDARPVELIRHLEYHLLLGVDHVLTTHATAREPLTSRWRQHERGLVTVYSQLRCRSLRNVARAPAGQRREFDRDVHQARSSLAAAAGRLLAPANR